MYEELLALSVTRGARYYYVFNYQLQVAINRTHEHFESCRICLTNFGHFKRVLRVSRWCFCAGMQQQTPGVPLVSTRLLIATGQSFQLGSRSRNGRQQQRQRQCFHCGQPGHFRFNRRTQTLCKKTNLQPFGQQATANPERKQLFAQQSQQQRQSQKTLAEQKSAVSVQIQIPAPTATQPAESQQRQISDAWAKPLRRAMDETRTAVVWLVSGSSANYLRSQRSWLCCARKWARSKQKTKSKSKPKAKFLPCFPEQQTAAQNSAAQTQRTETEQKKATPSAPKPVTQRVWAALQPPCPLHLLLPQSVSFKSNNILTRLSPALCQHKRSDCAHRPSGHLPWCLFHRTAFSLIEQLRLLGC